MDVDVTSIAFKGSEADATVMFRAKGADASSGLQMRYTLEQKSGKWVVKEKAQASGSPHGAAANPGGALPPGHPPMDAGEAKNEASRHSGRRSGGRFRAAELSARGCAPWCWMKSWRGKSLAAAASPTRL